jgi:hypothetical protein
MKTTISVLLAGLASGSLLLATPVAHADSNTDQFLSDVHAAGYGVSSDASALSNGEMVCKDFRQAMSGSDVAVLVASHTEMSTRDVIGLTLTAVADLCPQYTGVAVAG